MAETADPPATPAPANATAPPAEPMPGGLPPPTLAAWYGKPKPKIAAWVKAVRAAGDSAFADAEAVSHSLAECDPDLSRTAALAKVVRPPRALEKWLQDVTRQLLAARLRDVPIDPQAPAQEQVGRIADGLAPGLRAKGRVERAAAENLLRLAIRRVTDHLPELDAGELLARLYVPLRAPDADSRLAPKELGRRVRQATIAQLREMSLVQSAALDRVRSAQRARAEAQDKAEDLAATLAGERAAAEGLRQKLAATEQRVAADEAELGQLRQALADNRQLGAHDTAALLGRVRSLLAGRLDPLLADAADALEIEPPVTDVARDRIASGRRVIRGEIQWLDESSGSTSAPPTASSA